ncbi:hypothetical protein H5395_16870 [Paracoccus sp. MC1854]|uniref:hypothetical protein n=1 Tax=Paracoccus sp. MC1854 TaxID=2760306 RepID=UPI001601B033|nr:hypothetical protein [Paracoccus sp. MC1854]MBB1493143.1 hypothetical protein [Paracoccus sp. MC1854]
MKLKGGGAPLQNGLPAGVDAVNLEDRRHEIKQDMFQEPLGVPGSTRSTSG